MAITDRRGVAVSSTDPAVPGSPNPDLAVKTPVRVATTAAIALTGLQTIDGVALAADDRVLVKDQADQTTNGIYAASTGVWTRTSDAANNYQWAQGVMVLVTQGTANLFTVWVMTAAGPITLGTTSLTWSYKP